MDVSQAGWGDLTGQEPLPAVTMVISRTYCSKKDWYGVTSSRGSGRASGTPVELKTPAVWTIHKGKIVRVAWFRTRKEALEAAGLSE